MPISSTKLLPETRSSRCLGLLGDDFGDALHELDRIIVTEARHRLGSENAVERILLAIARSAFLRALDDRRWDDAAAFLEAGIRSLEGLGAQAVFVASSRLQMAAAKLQSVVPCFTMTDTVVPVVRRARIKRIAILGTRGDDEERFWRQRFAATGIRDLFFPTPLERRRSVELLDSEFSRHLLSESSRTEVLRMVYGLRRAGARALVVTEPTLNAAFRSDELLLPVFDATELHAVSAVEWAINGATSSAV